MKRIGFFIRHFGERGSEIAIYDYAHYNETILGNRSYILYFSKEAQEKAGLPPIRTSFERFEKRFPMIELYCIEDMKDVICLLNLDVFYTLVSGGEENTLYKFNDTSIWQGCKTIKHCMFEGKFPEADINLVIHDSINKKDTTSLATLNHIVTLPEVEGNLRSHLGIPESATVFGGYGGKDNFSIPFAKQVVYSIAQQNPNIYFLFANFTPFCPPLPNIIHLSTIIDIETKVRFIQTCDAMLWARADGETFGLAIAEFSIKNKPIFCAPCGDLAHIDLLKERAILYTNPQELYTKLLEFKKDIMKLFDWNAYRDFTPEKVMKEQFSKYI